MGSGTLDVDEAGFSGEPVEELVYSSMMRGHVRRELLSLVVEGETADLGDEEEVLRSVREGARDRVE